MRWIFFTLVFGNLLLLAMFWQKQSDVNAAPLSALEIPGTVKRLQLVSEAGDSLQPAAPRDRSSWLTVLCRRSLCG